MRYSTELRGHSSGIEQVAFNPVRESELASCSADGTVRFWDVRSKNCIERVDVGGEAFSLSWAADGKVILVGRKVNIRITTSRTRDVEYLLIQLLLLAGRHSGSHFGRISFFSNHPTNRDYSYSNIQDTAFA